MICHVDTGNQIQVHCKRASALSCKPPLQPPDFALCKLTHKVMSFTVTFSYTNVLVLHSHLDAPVQAALLESAQ